MPLEKIGIDLNAFNNLTLPTFDIKNTSEAIINDIPVKANEISGGFIGLASLTTLFTFLMWKFNQEQVGGGDFGYGTSRSIGIAASICGIVGLYMINIGYFTNFYHITIFIVIALISVGVVYRSSI